MQKYIMISLLLFTAACATPEQLAEQQAMQEQSDTNTCINYGLKPGTELFGNCRLQLDLAREQRYYSRPAYYPHAHFNYHHWY